MPAYVIGEVAVHDPEAYAQYRAGVSATLEPYGARFVVRGGRAESLEGGWSPPRLVIIEFPSMDAARRWYASPGYGRLRALRQAAAASRLVLVEGVP